VQRCQIKKNSPKKEEKSSKIKKEGQHDQKSKETQQKYIRKLHKTIKKPKKNNSDEGRGKG
jgi:hypothetical protein